MTTLLLLSSLASSKILLTRQLVVVMVMGEKLLAGAVQTEVNEVPPAQPVIPAGRAQVTIGD